MASHCCTGGSQREGEVVLGQGRCTKAEGAAGCTPSRGKGRGLKKTFSLLSHLTTTQALEGLAVPKKGMT